MNWIAHGTTGIVKLDFDRCHVNWVEVPFSFQVLGETTTKIHYGLNITDFIQKDVEWMNWIALLHKKCKAWTPIDVTWIGSRCPFRWMKKVWGVIIMIQDQSITRSKYVESDVAVRTTGKSYRYDVLSFYSSRNVFVSSRPMWCGKFVPPRDENEDTWSSNSKRGAAGPGCGIEDELDHHVVLPAPSPSSFVKHCQQLGTTTSCLSVCL